VDNQATKARLGSTYNQATNNATVMQTLITNMITTQTPNKNTEKSHTLHENSITHYLTTTTVHPDVTQ